MRLLPFIKKFEVFQSCMLLVLVSKNDEIKSVILSVICSEGCFYCRVLSSTKNMQGMTVLECQFSRR